LSVNLTKPKRGKFELDSGVVFPTEHLKRILRRRKRRDLLEVKVYDGSETGEKLYETTTYIGHPIADPAVEKAAHIPELDNVRRWPVSISYFETGKKDGAPSYICRSTSMKTVFRARSGSITAICSRWGNV